MEYKKYEISEITSLDSLIEEIAKIRQIIDKYSAGINNMFPPTYYEREVYGKPLSFKEKMQLFKYKIDFQKEYADILSIGEALDECEALRTDAITYESELLIDYLHFVLEQEENGMFFLSKDVSNMDNGISLNQKIINYLSSFGEDSLLPFTVFCSDVPKYYHLILPKEDYVKLWLSQGKVLHEIPIFCFPKGEEILVLDENDDFKNIFLKLPYLENAIKKLINMVLKNGKSEIIIKSLMEKSNYLQYQYYK